MDPITIGLLLGGGSLLSFLGGRRENNAANRNVSDANRRNAAEDARLEAEQRTRAGGRASLMRGIMNASGFGGTMTDEQILAMLTRTPRRTPTLYGQPNGSIFSSLGRSASTVGNLGLMGSTNLSPTAGTAAEMSASTSDWEQFMANLMAGQTRRPGAGVTLQ